jgi:hypothetical protein
LERQPGEGLRLKSRHRGLCYAQTVAEIANSQPQIALRTYPSVIINISVNRRSTRAVLRAFVLSFCPLSRPRWCTACPDNALPDEDKRRTRVRAIIRSAVNRRQCSLHDFSVMHTLSRTFVVDNRYRAMFSEKRYQLANNVIQRMNGKLDGQWPPRPRIALKIVHGLQRRVSVGAGLSANQVSGRGVSLARLYLQGRTQIDICPRTTS